MLLSNIRVICIKVSKHIAKGKRKNERETEIRVKQLEELIAIQPSSATLQNEYYRKKDELHLFPANLGGSAHIIEIVQPNSTIRHSAQLNGNSASISSY